jgi:hypothetical protein
MTNDFPSNESGCVAMPIARTVAKAKGETWILILIELLLNRMNASITENIVWPLISISLEPIDGGAIKAV